MTSSSLLFGMENHINIVEFSLTSMIPVPTSNVSQKNFIFRKNFYTPGNNPRYVNFSTDGLDQR